MNPRISHAIATLKLLQKEELVVMQPVQKEFGRWENERNGKGAGFKGLWQKMLLS